MVTAVSSPSDAGTELEQDYLQLSHGYLRMTPDRFIVVEGTELPCHKQILALHSKVFSDMMEMTSDVGQRAHGNTLEAYE